MLDRTTKQSQSQNFKKFLKWQRLGWTTEKGLIFNTGPYGDPPLRIKILKIGLLSDVSWPKVGLKPKFHDPGTFGGFGKREQTHRHTRFMFYQYRFSGLSTLDHMGTPLKNQNFENWAS